MTKIVEYQDSDVTVVSRNPLRGALKLVTDDDHTTFLELDRDSAEWLVSALLDFLMEGKHPETPKMTVEPAADAARGRDQVLTAIFEGIAAAYQATLYENNDPLDNCATFAETALAWLESSGLRVVR
ncbi:MULTISPECIES: hypothetical protein [unclassified Mesorhizobium]|uniref:hypothetical protein n=1 Tax=unclassified Mesorhizobium TaxID=325217 RepID=UPI0003CF48EF|nr:MULTISPECIES: hypothetical protein [unclassified Mesorhizobium]ESY22190.1 hypothetical protein X751_08245 [Mesorhizobium sp. LNJC395A00]ESZ38743.1 hypothetical protein X732_17955 [Mesorhizobium sp. L2C066B000]WJI77958.1 hypothetical protein NLY37_15180 [Mesorhizobium sp. C395A]